MSPASLGLLAPGLLVATACGVAGGAFARLVIASLTLVSSPMNRWRLRWPVTFAAPCGFAIAVIGQISGGETFGSGSATVQQLLTGGLPLPLVDTALKFVVIWLTSWCGTSGGLLAPSLSIGGGIGDWIAQLFDPLDRTALIALGMAGFLAAVTQTPVTAALIVAEMIGGVQIGLALLPACASSSLLSRNLSPPMYATLHPANGSGAHQERARRSDRSHGGERGYRRRRRGRVYRWGVRRGACCGLAASCQAHRRWGNVFPYCAQPRKRSERVGHQQACPGLMPGWNDC